MRLLSIFLGAVLAAWIAHGLHNNPRWTWAPGEGELPRDVVAMYMDMAYKQGDVGKAAELFFSPKTKDEVAPADVLPGGAAFEPRVLRVVAEGFNVVVHYTAALAGGDTQYVEIFKVQGGRIASRERIIRQAGAQPGRPLAASGDGSAPDVPGK